MDLTLESKVQYLYDRALISETINRFFLAVDEKAWETVREVIHHHFLLTAPTLASQPGEPQPVDEFIQQLIARNGGFTGTTHLNPDHLIAINGDSAHVKAHMYCPHWVDETDQGMYLAYGRYDVDLIRTPDGWRMTSLLIHIDGHRGDAKHVYAVAAERMATRPREV